MLLNINTSLHKHITNTIQDVINIKIYMLTTVVNYCWHSPAFRTKTVLIRCFRRE